MCGLNKFLFFENCRMFSLLLLLNVIAHVLCDQDGTVSINKPITRNRQPPWMNFSTDYVRCFCNLPSCVTTGYMCKSSQGGCFSDLLDQNVIRSTVYRGRHGCLELLPESQRTGCPVNLQVPVRKKEHPRSLLLCCYHDMCNHLESPQTKTLFNSTLLDEKIDDTDNRYQQRQETLLYTNSEVWLRAATIAVPICGAVILFALIALAVKILKTENQNSIMNQKLEHAMYVHHVPLQNKTRDEKSYDHFERQYETLIRKPSSSSHQANIFYHEPHEKHCRQFQVPLLVQNEINNPSGDKNEENAKSNLLKCDLVPATSLIYEIEKESPECSNLNIVKNINNSNCDEKFCNAKSLLS